MEATEASTIGVGIIGAGWMGHQHARAYSRLKHHYPLLPHTPELVAVASRRSAAAALSMYGIQTHYTDWRDLVADPRIDAVSVTTPTSLHREVGVAVAQAGKHLWIEKPVGLDAADVQAVAAAVASNGVCSTVGFTYRNVPAVARARALIASGAIGRVTHGRLRFLSDYAADPRIPMSWRFRQATAGNGVVLDLAVHAVDLIRFLIGDVATVVADSERFIRERPRSAEATGVEDVGSGDAREQVDNDDYVAFLGRTTSDALLFLEASRVAVGEQNGFGFDIQGDRGRVSWDFHRPSDLTLSSGQEFVQQPTTVIVSAAGDGDYAMFQPAPGLPLGFDDLKVMEAAAFLGGVARGASGGATVEDALATARVLDAVKRSTDSGSWVSVA